MSDTTTPRSTSGEEACSERGVTLVLVAFAMVGMLVVAALLLDLGLVRDERRSHQSAVDFAALAAGEALGWEPGPDGPAGCAAAMDYLIANVEELPTNLQVPCTSLPKTCSSAMSPVTVTDAGTGGDFDIAITYPVTNSTIVDPAVAATDDLRVFDGVPCERIRIEMSSRFDSIFAPIVGKSFLEVDASAVVRQVQATDRRVPSMWLLEPRECDNLIVTGGSSVVVGNATTAGLITLDSDGSACTGSNRTVDVSGTGSSVRAIPTGLALDPEISLVAMERLQTTCATGNLYACDPADVSDGSLSPQPVPRANRATRAPVDHRYNCKPSYPDYHGIPVDGCQDGLPPHIDNLRTAVGASGTPTGFLRWTDFYGCNNPTVPATGLNGNWHVDCTSFKLTSNTVVFNEGNIVFDGDISLTGGSLSFNDDNTNGPLSATCRATVVGCLSTSSPDAAWVYQRSGNLSLTGGSTLFLKHTMLLQENGFFEIAGGSPPVWSSPVDGPFAGLSVWTEKASSKFSISGGASMELEGTFFTPEANPMSISGGAPVSPQQAQFVSRKVSVNGGASIQLSPNQTLAVLLPPDPPLLIR